MSAGPSSPSSRPGGTYGQTGYKAYSGTGPAASSSASQPFTPAMRDRQARGKDPYAGTAVDLDASGADSSKMRLSSMPETEPFAKVEQRAHAATVLDSPELLMMYAQSSGDSIPATRHRFMRLLCGYDDASATAASRRYESQHQHQHQHQHRERRHGGSSAQQRHHHQAGF